MLQTADPSRTPIPEAVETALRQAWPDQADDILADLKWQALDGFFFFTRWGMFVGVETDGYIHT